MRNRNRNRLTYISLMLACSLALTDVLPVSAGEYSTYGQFIAGEGDADIPGTEEEYTVITVSTEAELWELAWNCQLDSWSRDKYVRLEEDITLQDNPNLTIPTFGGIFDGGGHKISNLNIETMGSALGLFRYVQENGVVKNLSVSGKVCPGGSKSQVGFLAGVNYGKIINCSVSGRVEGAEEIGGIAGVNETTGEIRQCQSAAVVTGDHYTGGICGRNNGTLNNCENSGNINTYSVDVAYGLEDITIETLEDLNRAENVAAHTDTGGIAGYSQGKIYYCSNAGTVGYQHVGYNTGGIVGRLHQGYLQNCTNTGHVLGRKDVGGIAGQMEPFLEIQYLNDKLSEIDREGEEFFNLLEMTHEELSAYSREAAALTKNISASLKNVSAAAGNLTGTTNDLWYIYNQELSGIGSDLSRLSRELEDQAAADREKANAESADAKNPGDSITTPDDTAIPDEATTPDDTATPDEATTPDDTATPDEATTPDDTAIPDEITIPNTPWDNGIQLDLEEYFAAMRRFGDSTSNHLANITNATGDRNEGIRADLETLNRELESAGNSLQQLTQVLGNATERTSVNIDALMAQAKVLRHSIRELRDDLFRYEGLTVADASDETAGEELENLGAETEGEEAYYDTSAFQQGKITLCVNRGMVEADSSVGGIVGQVATEYDFDPEDDITISGTESFHIEQTVKAVVRESRNLGDVTGKKDYVGGIVGRADFGAVISCESYGRVSSTGGNYVGGVVGSSSYCIRNCYFMGALSGKNCVGGIAGRGSDIFYSGSYPELEFTGEHAGSIAGQLVEDGILYGNYYVQDTLHGSEEEWSDGAYHTAPGVDSIGYEGGAAPLSYAEFCSVEGVPNAFAEFTVSFQADGRELASFQCGYGDAIEEELIPEIPEKEGFYGIWPEFDYACVTGNKVLEARYEKWISALASRERDESGRTKVLVEGEFLPGTELILEEREEGTAFSLVCEKEGETVPAEYDGVLTVRVLCENTDQSAVELWEEGGYVTVPTETMGSYLEFSMEGVQGVFRIAVSEKDNRAGLWITAAAGLGLALVLVLLVKRLRRAKGNRS